MKFLHIIMLPSVTTISLCVTLLWCNLASAVDSYWNLPARPVEGFSIDVLTGGIADNVAYPACANTSLNNNLDTYYNPSALIRLLDRLMELQSNNSVIGRKLDHDSSFVNVLETVGLQTPVSLVYMDADNPIGSSGPTSREETPFSDQVDACTEELFVEDLSKPDSRWITNLLKSGESWLFGEIGESLEVTRTIARWIRDSSTKSTCNAFTFALYDNSDIAKAQHVWIIAGVPWTKGSSCATTASLETIVEAVQELILHENEQATAGARNHLSDFHSWSCDLRIVKADLAASCGMDLWRYKVQ